MKTILLLLALHLTLLCRGGLAADKLTFIVMDVGEGQAVVLNRGEHGVLIDTGHFGVIHETVKSIRAYGVTKLDHLLLTHLHPDHSSGVFTVMENFPEAEIYESGHRIPFNPVMDAVRWVAEALDSGRWAVRRLSQGDSLVWQGVEIEILWPKKVQDGGMLNQQSLAAAVRYCGKTALIMGDVDSNIEKNLMEQALLPDSVDILVVGHHGAADATSEAFIQKVQPMHAVVSINRNNIRGYPDEKVIERLKKSGAQLYLTYRESDVVFQMCP